MKSCQRIRTSGGESGPLAAHARRVSIRTERVNSKTVATTNRRGTDALPLAYMVIAPSDSSRLLIILTRPPPDADLVEVKIATFTDFGNAKPLDTGRRAPKMPNL